MRAALIERYGELPVVRTVADPEPSDSLTLVRVTAAGLNPVDLSMASGRFYAPPPTPPYIPGGEGVGRIQSGGRHKPGTRVYFLARPGAGSFAERTMIDDTVSVELPDAVDDGTAIALGTSGIPAWLGLERSGLKSGERVLVLGASGVLGSIAVQVARIQGAGRVVAAARDHAGLERARRYGADATVDLSNLEGVSDAIREASGGGVDVIIDPLWGAVASAASEAINPFGRLVQIGQSAGPEATLKSNVVRGRAISILGYSNFRLAPEVRMAAYRRLCDAAAAGRIQVDVEVVPLDQVADAWRRQSQSPHHKLVLAP